MTTSTVWTLAPDAELVDTDMTNIKDVIDAAVSSTQGMYEIKPPVVVFGKPARQQRNVCFVSKESSGYFYSNNLMRSKYPTHEQELLLKFVNEKFKPEKPYNGILINEYPDGDHYIGAHSDAESGVDARSGVVAISHGAIRKFRINRAGSTRSVIDVPTKPYHAIQMRGSKFQKLFQHGIPVEKKVRSKRTSITFRYHDPEEEKAFFSKRGMEWRIPRPPTSVDQP